MNLDKKDLVALSEMSWSWSKVGVFRSCQYRFYLQYIARLPIPERAEVLDIGEVVHRICDVLTKNFKETKSNCLSLELMYEHIQKETLDYEFDLRIAKFLEKCLVNFRNTFNSCRENVSNLESEFKLAFTRDFTLVEWYSKTAFFRLAIDLLEYLDNYKIRIWDYKIGKELVGFEQLAIYAGALERIVNASASSYRLNVFHLGSGDIEFMDCGSSDVATTWNSLVDEIDRYSNFTELLAFPEKLKCSDCPYRNFCNDAKSLVNG